MPDSSANMRLPIKTLRECLRIGDGGQLYWLARPLHHFRNSRACNVFNGRFAGKRAFTTQHDGYFQGTITLGELRVCCRAHQVIWALTNGRWPTLEIDHRNRRRGDNAPANLREVSRGENSHNTSRTDNATGFRGVTAHENGRFSATVTHRKKRIRLGRFDTAESAHAAYLAESQRRYSA